VLVEVVEVVPLVVVVLAGVVLVVVVLAAAGVTKNHSYTKYAATAMAPSVRTFEPVLSAMTSP